ncbi:hypothetical protein [Solidesulfovibrio sp.]
MLQHIPPADTSGEITALRADLAVQDERLNYFRQLLGDIESVFGRLHSGLTMLHVGIEELAKEKEQLPIRKADKPKPRRGLSRPALALPERSASRVSRF